ncbi:endonuclease domain-containing protein [Brachybacterium saurashtrense]|uniref:DUF559 domain-containing protein n=1 Tax=Brachybacterium saurashtrense TaxID=556288 RepID=A0A345YQM7_9MICO|nr:DUF559 domain-containing protein [Brachybacterium saurashtrense]AXK46229.1 DUF559 domain-containing protein [Brachybacterium saurashtrense]RRR23969.1 DUF559 domain-containing protein [Brachybacterium saurashtrense]
MRATSLPPGTLLHREQWLDLGVSTARLHGPELFALFRGFSTPTAAPATVNTMCEVLQRDVIPGAVISHGTAAALMGIPLPWWLDQNLGRLAGGAHMHQGRRIIPSTLSTMDETQTSARASATEGRSPVQIPADSTQSEGPPVPRHPLRTPPLLHCRVEPGLHTSAGPYVSVHRTPPRPSWTHSGIELSHPHVVLLELATYLPHDDLVVAVDSLISRDPPLRTVTLEGIWCTVKHCTASWGAPALRKALEDARPNSGSPGETRTRLLLQRAGFPEPVLNHPVHIEGTGRRRYLDLAYPDLRIGVEYDGDYHRRTTVQRRQDQARKDTLESQGWTLRFLNAEDIAQPQRFLTALQRTFLRAGAAAPPTSNWSGRAARALARPIRAPTSR